MKVKFQTKKESNLEQELTFLSLSPGERFSYWLNLMVISQQIPNDFPVAKSDNFLIVIER
ncbi:MULTISPECIES: hypothetical protein [Maribacter]|uniref:hypothetical protein n=1 Tax=Maribacter TaxID=252356 RepID=UPI00237FAD05|nr:MULTISPECIES: hypothetical protein [Maribacter]MDE3744131.1 hypothetical protein [Maribacter polysaccharolyticus]|tara:strand:+ start:1949 stop:2128 length:180 start_codon:yes stop_codon:yes gene_type:complete